MLLFGLQFEKTNIIVPFVGSATFKLPNSELYTPCWDLHIIALYLLVLPGLKGLLPHEPSVMYSKDPTGWLKLHIVPTLKCTMLFHTCIAALPRGTRVTLYFHLGETEKKLPYPSLNAYDGLAQLSWSGDTRTQSRSLTWWKESHHLSHFWCLPESVLAESWNKERKRVLNPGTVIWVTDILTTMSFDILCCAVHL